MRPLTTKQCRVAELIAVGHSIKSTATTIGISEATVKVHLTWVYAKLNIAGKDAMQRLRVGVNTGAIKLDEPPAIQLHAA